jgi:hypothetical protein
MKARPECISCIIEQALTVAKSVTTDDWLQKKVLIEGMKTLAEADLNRTPAEILFEVVRKASRTLGKKSALDEDKALITKDALELKGKSLALIEKSGDRLKTAAKIAAAAGIVNLCSKRPLELESAVTGAPAREFAVDDFDEFLKDCAKAKKILYILGNAGEAVFDVLFIAEMKDKTVTAVARKLPLLLDATTADARAAGVDKVAKVVDPGADVLGLPLELVSREFRTIVENADLIIAKGQNNYETLAGAKLPPAYFVLNARCECVARSLGVKVADIVFAKNAGE